MPARSFAHEWTSLANVSPLSWAGLGERVVRGVWVDVPEADVVVGSQS